MKSREFRIIIERAVFRIAAVSLCLVVASCRDKKDEETDKPEPIGLVLSGGAGKGAYEVGVWQELHVAGLASRVTAISGTSIGAINAAIFATRPNDAERIWREKMVDVIGIKDIRLRQATADAIPVVVSGKRMLANSYAAAVNGYKALEAHEESKKWYKFPFKRDYQDKQSEHVESGLQHMGEVIKTNIPDFVSVVCDWMESNSVETTEYDSFHEGYVDASGLSDMLASCLPEVWPSNAPAVYATAVKKSIEKIPVTWYINAEPHERRVNMLRASAAVPYVEFGVSVKAFDPVEIDGSYYVDGFLADNTPIKPIIGCHPNIKTVIAVYLSSNQKLDKNKREANRLAASCAGVSLLEIIPSKDIEEYKSSITEDSVSYLIGLGRADTHAVLKSSGLVMPMAPVCVADVLLHGTVRNEVKVNLRYEKRWLKNVFKVEIPESLLDAVETRIVLMNGTNDVLEIGENIDKRTSVLDERERGLKIVTLTFSCRRKMLKDVDSVKFVFEHKYCPVEITYKLQLPMDVQQSNGDVLYVPERIKIAGDERSISDWANLRHNQGERRE